MLHNRSFAKGCLISRNPEADFQHTPISRNTPNRVDLEAIQLISICRINPLNFLMVRAFISPSAAILAVYTH